MFRTTTTSIILASGLAVAAAMTAAAQSTEEVLGTAIGGTAGAVIGGELDNKGSKDEDKIIGAVVGGTLGYVIGDNIDDRNDDRRLRDYYEGRPGTYYEKDGRAYRRYSNPDYGFVSFPILDDDPYFYRDGRKKSHPVFAEHPGKGRGKGLRKDKRRYR